ncbi:MAG: transglutaminase domain-containing protein [Wujia sp.]
MTKTNKKKKRRFQSVFVLVLCMLLSMLSPLQLQAKELNAENLYVYENPIAQTGDLKPMEVIEIPDAVTDERGTETAEYTITNHRVLDATPSAVFRNDWSVYSDQYCYNNMTPKQQEIYSTVYAQCVRYINYQLDATEISSLLGTRYCIGPITYEGITLQEVIDVIYTFIYQNPQFYFLQNSVIHNSTSFYLVVFDSMANGATRSQISKSMFTKVDTMVSMVQAKTTALDKALMAHDLVCANVLYVEGTYDQSLYSAVLLGKTVCAGYTKLFSVLANAAGLDCVGITSNSHAWNRILLNGMWYNVDTTWDDRDDLDGCVRTYFGTSDAALLVADSKQVKESHTQNDYYEKWAPSCPCDYGATAGYVEASGLVLSATQLDFDMNVNKVAYLTCGFLPGQPTDTKLVYQSSDTSVVAVAQNGTVQAVGPGTAVITVRKPTNNLKVTCAVSVRQALPTPAAPKLQNRTTNSIVLVPIEGCLYSKDGKNWQKSAIFKNLKPNTAYTFYMKKEAVGNFSESAVSLGATFKTKALPQNISYRTKQQSYGWSSWAKDGKTAGKTGKTKRVEAFKIKINNAKYTGNVVYNAYMQGKGWQAPMNKQSKWKKNGASCGATGKRVEAIAVNLTGKMKTKYDIYYRVYVKGYGWLGWAKNGKAAGTRGFSKAVEGIQIKLVNKGGRAPGKTSKCFVKK